MGSSGTDRRRRSLLLKTGFVGAVLVTALSLVAISWADDVVPDGDIVAPGDQASVNLGSVSPGQVLNPSASFKLACGLKQHVDQGQSLPLDFTLSGSTVPSGGALSATNASIGPIPASWPDDTTGGGSTNCGSPGPAPIADSGDSSVTITAPASSGSKTFVVRWNFGALTPVGNSDNSAVQSNHVDVTYTLTVVGDTTAPTINCTVPDQALWYAADVSVNCTASDGGSGLANPTDASFSLSTSVPSGSETASASTGSRNVCDTAGNCATAGPYTFKVDKKAPGQTGCDSADGLWHAGDVTLHCTYSDGGSGPASQQVALSTNVPADTEDGNASASANGAQACDDVGNCADSPGDIAGNKVDKKAPSVSCGSADGNWHASDVSIACSAGDGGSGLANAADANFNLTTSVAANTEDGNASTTSHAVADGVGNTVTAGPISGNKIDKKAPIITCTSPAPVFVLNQSPANVTGAAADGGSGPPSQALSAPADTSSVLGNPKSVILSASDNVGNSSSQPCAYSVVFGFHGFFQPVDNNGVYNVVNSGRAIPVKFDLSGNQGLDIFAAGYPASTVVPCTGGGGTDPLEETLTAGNSSLSYGTGQPFGQYNYVWKTDKSWANTCRRLDLKFTDGTTRSALFKFTR